MPLRPRVLVVDDVSDVLDILREALDAAGFDIDTAATPTEALDCLATRPCAGIVADCMLPDLPPLDWLAELRGAAPTTPLILYSGTILGDELQRQAAEFRAAGVLEKPFSVADLVETVRRVIP